MSFSGVWDRSRWIVLDEVMKTTKWDKLMIVIFAWGIDTLGAEKICFGTDLGGYA